MKVNLNITRRPPSPNAQYLGLGSPISDAGTRDLKGEVALRDYFQVGHVYVITDVHSYFTERKSHSTKTLYKAPASIHTNMDFRIHKPPGELGCGVLCVRLDPCEDLRHALRQGYF